MDDMEQKIGAVLNNPELMQKIMNMAQSFGQTPAASQEKAGPSEPDLAMIQKLSGLAQSSGIDQEQKALLSALTPYLTRSRIVKLENAMRAAKLARLASAMIGNGGLKLHSGR